MLLLLLEEQFYGFAQNLALSANYAPVELRRQFNLAEGDYLEAQVVPGGILLKPVSVVEREKAWTEVMKVMKEVHAKHPATKLSPREEEEWIAKQVKAFRKTRRPKSHA